MEEVSLLESDFTFVVIISAFAIMDATKPRVTGNLGLGLIVGFAVVVVVVVAALEVVLVVVVVEVEEEENISGILFLGRFNLDSSLFDDFTSSDFTWVWVLDADADADDDDGDVEDEDGNAEDSKDFFKSVDESVDVEDSNTLDILDEAIVKTLFRFPSDDDISEELNWIIGGTDPVDALPRIWRGNSSIIIIFSPVILNVFKEVLMVSLLDLRSLLARRAKNFGSFDIKEEGPLVIVLLPRKFPWWKDDVDDDDKSEIFSLDLDFVLKNDK